ncbi:TlpA family protein disulfide reductase [Mycolicibacterium sp. XJ1819]
MVRGALGLCAPHFELPNAERDSMVTPAQRPSIPPALTSAARLRRDGRTGDAKQVIGAALASAHAAPAEASLRERVLLVIALADLHLATDQIDTARRLLAAEAAFADAALEFSRRNGTPDQTRSAELAARQLRDRETQVNLLGRQAPEIQVADWLPGPPATEPGRDGNVLLLEFWGRSCRACTAMMPALTDFHRRYQHRGLTVLALTRYGENAATRSARSRERDLVAKAAADGGLAVTVGIAPDDRLQRCYGANGLPTFAIVDRAGRVRLASSIPDKTKMDRLIDGLLDEPVPQAQLRER